jgi:release factor glutamine methyltransferase
MNQSQHGFMKTLGELLTVSSQFLKEKNCTRPRRVAEELIAHVLKLNRLDLYMQFDRPLVEEEMALLRALLKRSVRGEPVEYITGEVSFYHCAISVTPDVLIPRPETEILVDIACKQLKAESLAGKTVWDLCTGSGCIGIAVKKACPELAMTLSDLSEKALAVAAKNAQANGVEVEIVCGDLLAPFSGRKADVVFCNPPYIDSKEFLTLDTSVKDFEPQMALDGGEGGLAFYRRLNEALPAQLNSGAKVYFEIGTGQGKALLELFSAKGWRNARVEKDWAGHERFFFLEFE